MFSSNAQKTPVGKSLNRLASDVADKVVKILGKSLPASVVKIMGAIVTVNYEISGANTLPNTSMSTLGSRYLRLPIQPGEKGMTISGDAYLGGMSGMGGGVADLTTRGNLSMSVWTAIGNASWPPVDPDVNTLTGGPNGVLLRDSESPTATVVLKSNLIQLTVGGFGIVITPAGTMIDGKMFLPHEHTKTQPGGGISGPVN